MSFYVKKALFVTLIFILFFALIFSFTTNRTKKEIQKPNYTLKSYKNTVALYNNEELLTVYDDIVLNTLPQNDIEHFKKGIAVSSPAQAEAYLQDFE